MMSKKQESKSESKRKQNFMCCACFGRKRSSSNFSIIGLSEQNEPYEYVVEKLAIKKVPLSLFATAEDIEKHSKTISSTSTPSTVSRKSEKATPTTLPLREKKSSVTFSTYYKLSQQPDLEPIAQIGVPQHESPPPFTSFPGDETQAVVCSAFQHRSKPKRVLTEDEEIEMVSHILNTHSSLFTLDPKQPIPKDPEHPPKNKVVVPPCVQAVLNNPNVEQFPPIHGRRQIRVDVHRASELPPPKIQLFMPPMKSPAPILPTKKELTPELKQTINALGFAQRPHIPGLPPKNQRSLQGGGICEGFPEKEMCSSALGKTLGVAFSIQSKGGDHILEESLSKEMVCQGLEPREKRLVCKPTKKKTVTLAMQSSYEDSDCCNGSSSKLQYLQSNVPRLAKNVIVEHYSAAQNNKPIMATPDRSCNYIQSLPTPESVGTSDTRLQDSDQTEISQLKGQSLKWKIIIKHHSDKKDKEDIVTSEKSDISDTDSESKPYLLDNRSLSPYR